MITVATAILISGLSITNCVYTDGQCYQSSELDGCKQESSAVIFTKKDLSSLLPDYVDLMKYGSYFLALTTQENKGEPKRKVAITFVRSCK